MLLFLKTNSAFFMNIDESDVEDDESGFFFFFFYVGNRLVSLIIVT